MLFESDIVPAQAPAHPKAGGDQNVPQLKASEDHNISQHQKGTLEVAKRFMEAIIFTKCPWPTMSDENYSMVDGAWTLAIEALDCQQTLAGAPVGTLPVCQLPGNGSLKIYLQTREAVYVNSDFISSIGLMMKVNPRNICS